MLHQFVKGRVYVFIDVENVFYAQRTVGWKISYQQLMAHLKRECGGDVKVFVYSGKDEYNIGQLKFLDMLEMNGYIVRTKVVKKSNSSARFIGLTRRARRPVLGGLVAGGGRSKLSTGRLSVLLIPALA